MSAFLYLAAWVGTLLDQFARLRPAGTAAGLAILAFLLLEFPRQRRYAQAVFLGLAALGLVGVAAASDPWALFLASWRRGASYAAFFLALTALRDAAETSPLVRRCGRHLVAQPPGRRYAALTGGGYVFGVILSYGAIDLLGAMVARANTLAAAGGSDAVRRLRARRMLMAIYRGFALMNCWSPLNIMTAVVSTAVPAAPMRLLLPIAFVVSLGLLALGWAEDRLHAAWRGLAGGARPETEERWAIHLRVVALVALVMALSEATSQWLGVSLVAAVTLVVPLVGVAWALLQAAPLLRRGGAAARRRVMASLGRRGRRFFLRVPGFRGEATVLAASGFMGAALGGALPAHGFAPALGVLPAVAIPLLVPVLLVATGQLGLNPVGVVALIGAALPDPLAVGVPPAVLAFACMLGWGVGVGMTPMSASAITTARWAETSPWTVSTVWNGAFTAAATLASWVVILALWRFLPFTAH